MTTFIFLLFYRIEQMNGEEFERKDRVCNAVADACSRAL